MHTSNGLLKRKQYRFNDFTRRKVLYRFVYDEKKPKNYNISNESVSEYLTESSASDRSRIRKKFQAPIRKLKKEKMVPSAYYNLAQKSSLEQK